MFKTFDLIILGIIIFSITITYSIKNEAEKKKEELKILEHKIMLEQNNIDLLKAQLALLVQPDRIKDLVVLYQKDLQLQPTNPINLISYDDLNKLKRKHPFSEDLLDSPKKTFKIQQHQKK
ncbi:cell division protein FtsL [Candidatus Liberibacter brunswickensis]|uniref:cell division protein FtsL n=1 Tax=Candidatus Liberibacter brunswickensis TaxID=1968796 RepID=UPI002FE3B4C6